MIEFTDLNGDTIHVSDTSLLYMEADSFGATVKLPLAGGLHFVVHRLSKSSAMGLLELILADTE